MVDRAKRNTMVDTQSESETKAPETPRDMGAETNNMKGIRNESSYSQGPNKFYFPQHNISIEADTQEEANDKLQTELKKREEAAEKTNE